MSEKADFVWWLRQQGVEVYQAGHAPSLHFVLINGSGPYPAYADSVAELREVILEMTDLADRWRVDFGDGSDD